MKKVIITGSSGMVGKAVLIECLESNNIEKVLIINRNSINLSHRKLQEILLKDFLQVDTIKDQLKGYDACFYCMGISVLGLSEEEYTKVTYTTAKAFVDVFFANSPDMTFNYVSGRSTDSTEKGNVMWARVKGKTENMIFNRGFKDAYAFRPGAIIPEKGVKTKTKLYNVLYILMRPFYPWLKKSKGTTTSSSVGQAMINSLLSPASKKVLEVVDINELAKRNTQ